MGDVDWHKALPIMFLSYLPSFQNLAAHARSIMLVVKGVIVQTGLEVKGVNIYNININAV